MKKIYFIDYENVGPNGLDGIKDLTSTDEVYFFHYVNAGRINYDNLLNMATSKAKTQIIRLSTHEKNAMDFQIVALLGYLSGKYENRANYYIVSKDNGYVSAIECLKNTINPSLKIVKTPSISGNKENSSLEAEIKAALDGKWNSKISNKVVSFGQSSKDLKEFHEHLQKTYAKDCDAIYRCVKPVLAKVI